MNDFYIENRKVHANVDMEFYAPEDYFKSLTGNEDMGLYSKIIGILPYVTITDGEQSEMKLFKVPTLINLQRYNIRNASIYINPDGDDEPTPCYVFEFIKDSIVCNADLVKNYINSEMFINYLLMGKIPTQIIPYDMLMRLWKQNLALNGVNPGVPDTILEADIAELCWWKKNNEIPFRKVFGKSPNVSPYDYVVLSVRESVKRKGVFSGFIYEDLGAMTTSGIIKTKKGSKEKESPIEPLMTM
jgi:hypothetical protein